MKVGGGATSGIDGTANALSKSICNLIKHNHYPFIIEYPRSGLTSETTPSIISKTTDLVTWMGSELGLRCQYFISDSYNSMRNVRRAVLNKKDVRWAYGGVTPCLINFCTCIAKKRSAKRSREGSFSQKPRDRSSFYARSSRLSAKINARRCNLCCFLQRRGGLASTKWLSASLIRKWCSRSCPRRSTLNATDSKQTHYTTCRKGCRISWGFPVLGVAQRGTCHVRSDL